MPRRFSETVGSLADWLRQLAHGIDDRPVVPNRETKSSGSENTYAEGPDRSGGDARRDRARWPARRAAWLARRSLLARTVTIKVRYADFTTITRSHTAPPTRDAAGNRRRGRYNCSTGPRRGRRPVRLLGVSVHNLCSDGDLVPGDWLPFG